MVALMNCRITVYSACTKVQLAHVRHTSLKTADNMITVVVELTGNGMQHSHSDSDDVTVLKKYRQPHQDRHR